MTEQQTVPCPGCRKDIIRPGKPIFACPYCRQEIRDDGQTLALVEDPPDFRRKVNDRIPTRNIFKDM